MSKPYIVALAESTQASVGPRLFRKQLLRKGTWVHPNDRSKKMVIDDNVITQMVTNFNDKVLDTVPVPMEHTEDPSKNTGFVIGLERTADGLDAILQLKDDDAATQISTGLIPGISASIDFEYLNKETGKSMGAVLRHAALVSNPYIKKLAGFDAVKLSDSESAVLLSEMEKKEGDPAMTLEEMIAALLKDHKIDVRALQAAQATITDGTVAKEAVAALGDKIKGVLGTVVSLSDTSETGIVGLVTTLVADKKTMGENLTNLSDRITGMEADKAVGVLLSEGKILPAQQKVYTDMFKSNKGMFDTLTATLTKVVDLGEHGHEGGGDDKSTAEKDAAEVERYSKMQ